MLALSDQTVEAIAQFFVYFVLILALRKMIGFRRQSILKNPDTTHNQFRLYVNSGERIGLKTPLYLAQAKLGEHQIEFCGDLNAVIPFAEISSIRLEFPHSSTMPAHVIEMKRGQEIFYFGVLSWSLGRFFVSSNSLQTISLFERIRRSIPALAPEPAGSCGREALSSLVAPE